MTLESTSEAAGHEPARQASDAWEAVASDRPQVDGGAGLAWPEGRRDSRKGAAMKDDGGEAAGIIISFVLGALTGAAVALLMAPTSGDETRRILTEKARDGREKANDAARQGREFLNRQRENLSTAVERGREAYEQARSGTTIAGADQVPGEGSL